MPRKPKPAEPEEESLEPWSHHVGKKGFNRVTVYERWPGGPLAVVWFTPRRRRKSLTTLTGTPIYDRDQAVEIAEAMSDAQRRKKEAETAHELLGRPMPHTLEELLDALHAERGGDWSRTHKQHQEGFQKFWLAALGKATDIVRVTPAAVEDKVRIAGKAKGWTPRTKRSYLRYILDAFYYAQRSLKWIEEKQNLSAVKMPKGKGKSLPYSLAELQKMFPIAPQVDLRVAAAMAIAWATGRRSGAILHLQVAELEDRPEQGELWIMFPGETDKARQSGETVLVGEGRRIVLQLLATPAVQASGKLFPWGDLADRKVRRGFITDNRLLKLLHRVEELAGVETIPYRGLHGIKRRYATEALAEDEVAASKQSGTRTDTLRSIYAQDDAGRKVILSHALDKKRRDASS